MTKMICISTFDLSGKIKNITLNKTYLTKFIIGEQILIINDKNIPQLVNRLNFVFFDKAEILKQMINL